MERTVAWNTYTKTDLRKLETVAKEYRASKILLRKTAV